MFLVRSAVLGFSAGGGGAARLQQYNKTQLSRCELNLKRFLCFISLWQAFTSAGSTVKKMHLDMTLLQSKCFTSLAFKREKKNLRKLSLFHNWIQVRN